MRSQYWSSLFPAGSVSSLGQDINKEPSGWLSLPLSVTPPTHLPPIHQFIQHSIGFLSHSPLPQALSQELETLDGCTEPTLHLQVRCARLMGTVLVQE